MKPSATSFLSSAKLRSIRTSPSSSLARQVPHTPEVQEYGTSRPADEAASRMLGWPLVNGISRLQAVAHDDDARLLGIAGLGLVHHGADRAGGGCATPKRSMWMRSSGTPAASSAASASSFIWNGPQT